MARATGSTVFGFYLACCGLFFYIKSTSFFLKKHVRWFSSSLTGVFRSRYYWVVALTVYSAPMQQNAIEAPAAEAAQAAEAVQAAVGGEERSPMDMAASGADNKAAAEEAAGAGEAEERSEPIKLHFSRKCCICGLPYFELHRFYDKVREQVFVVCETGQHVLAVAICSRTWRDETTCYGLSRAASAKNSDRNRNVIFFWKRGIGFFWIAWIGLNDVGLNGPGR
jgi:hypothetical protein